MRLQVDGGNDVLVLNGLSTSRIIGMIGVSHIQIFGVISNGFPVS